MHPDAGDAADGCAGRAARSEGAPGLSGGARDGGRRRCRPSPNQKRPKTSYFAHESAFIDEGVEIGDGTTIWHVSHVLKNSRIGKDCRIGQNVVIGPNVVVGNGVKIQNNVSVYEGVTLEDGVFCGPSMVFTNVINPRSEIRRMHELRSTLVRRGATPRGELHDRLRHDDRHVRLRRRRGRRRQGRAGLRARRRKPRAGHRLDVRLRQPNSIRRRRGEGSCADCSRTYTKQKRTVTLDA